MLMSVVPLLLRWGCCLTYGFRRHLGALPAGATRPWIAAVDGGDRLAQLARVWDTWHPQRSPEGSASQRGVETARNWMHMRTTARQYTARIRPESEMGGTRISDRRDRDHTQ
ncbi:hypothetical protein Rhe02_40660 [Rhizocola hellebori]|uniref:Uncharacterized protein n=1 Tax=Rhizocola hellebori TaxID=1392758 RepID=A0A8J3Q8H7_9ACTN|nr:hypothetical protein Rhe02_40660 [Rhizocola hellebori]